MVGSGDESGQQFSFDNVDDDDDDYDNGSYGTGGIVHPGTVANFANFDEVSFPSSFDFAFNADGSKVENFADFSSETFATAATSSGSGSIELFADFNAVGSFDAPAGTPLPGSAGTMPADLFDDFGISNTFDDIADRLIPVVDEKPTYDAHAGGSSAN
jgi:hypothetical protein